MKNKGIMAHDFTINLEKYMYNFLLYTFLLSIASYRVPSRGKKIKRKAMVQYSPL